MSQMDDITMMRFLCGDDVMSDIGYGKVFTRSFWFDGEFSLDESWSIPASSSSQHRCYVTSGDSVATTLRWKEVMSARLLRSVIVLGPLVNIRFIRAAEVYECTPWDLIQLHGFDWVADNQKGTFEMFWGRVYPSGPYSSVRSCLQRSRVQVTPPVRAQRVHFSTTGPTVNHVTVTVGCGSVLETLTDALGVLILMSESAGVPYDVSDTMKHIWLSSFGRSSAKLSSAEHYSEGLSGYSVWSMEPHAAQIKEILPSIPSSSTIVAPADGIGLIATLWEGSVVSGDLNVVDMTSEKTRNETIIETLRRGSLSNSPVVILSYASVFMSSADWEYLIKMRCPTFIVDVTDYAHNFPKSDPSWSPILIGPGVYGVNVPPQWGSATMRTEGVRIAKTVPYSENLLQVSVPIFLSRSPYMLYYLRQRPLAPFSVVNGFLGEVPVGKLVASGNIYVAVTLKEYLSVCTSPFPTYFAPIGRIQAYPSIHSLPQFASVGKFPLRAVCGMNRHSPLVDHIKSSLRTSSCYISAEMCYFFLSGEEIVSFPILSRGQTSISGLLHFIPDLPISVGSGCYVRFSEGSYKVSTGQSTKTLRAVPGPIRPEVIRILSSQFKDYRPPDDFWPLLEAALGGDSRDVIHFFRSASAVVWAEEIT